MKTNKNGIPILSYSFDNKPKKPRYCHPAMHVWVRDHSRPTKFSSEAIDVNHQIDYTHEPVRCSVCQLADYDTTSEVY